MKLKWKDLPNEVRKRLVIDLEDSKGTGFNGNTLLFLLKGCELLGYKWNERKGTRDAIVSAFVYALSNDHAKAARESIDCLHHFSNNGLNWKSLPTEVKTTIFREIEKKVGLFSSQDLLNLVYRYERRE
jgi:predicted AAA+ superfamily ATPase